MEVIASQQCGAFLFPVNLISSPRFIFLFVGGNRCKSVAVFCFGKFILRFNISPKVLVRLRFVVFFDVEQKINEIIFAKHLDIQKFKTYICFVNHKSYRTMVGRKRE